MISDEDVEKAIDFLRDSADKSARARAERLYLEEFSRPLKSSIMREVAGESLGAQEARAYCDPRYQNHLVAVKEAIHRDEYNRYMRDAANAKIEAWRTFKASERAGKI
jgi:hypothetical protein